MTFLSKQLKEIQKNTLFFLTIIVAVFLCLSCTSTPTSQNNVAESFEIEENPSLQKDTQTTFQEQIDVNPVALDVSNRQKKGFFYEVPDEILEAVEDGSPKSLENAMQKLQRFDKNYSEAEKTLMYIAKGIMKTAWNTEKITWEVPANIENNAYVGAINSVEKNIYDFSTGGVDFFTLELPSLVLLTNSVKNDYYNEATLALTLAVEINSNSTLANYLLGVLYNRLEKKELAVKHLKIAYEKAQDLLQVSYEYAKVLFEIGDCLTSEKIIEPLILRYPSDMNLQKLCAEVYFNLKDYKKAELYVARVLQQNPTDTEYLLFRAKILMEQGDFVKASSLLDVFARTNSTEKNYLILRSRIQREWNKNLRSAFETVEKAIKLYPTDKEVLLLAASLASETGDVLVNKNAEQLASEVLAIEPNNFQAQVVLVQELIENRKWTEAYKISLKLIKSQDVSNKILYNHIKICLALSKNTEAWELAQSLYNDNQTDELILQSYLEVLYAQGKFAESRNLIASLLPQASSYLKSFLYYRRSFLYNDSEQLVLADLRSSLISNPRNEDALYRLYTIYYNKKDYRRAQYYLKQVVAIHPYNKDFLSKNEELENLLK